MKLDIICNYQRNSFGGNTALFFSLNNENKVEEKIMRYLPLREYLKALFAKLFACKNVPILINYKS